MFSFLLDEIANQINFEWNFCDAIFDKLVVKLDNAPRMNIYFFPGV